jgi:hypothetical protein
LRRMGKFIRWSSAFLVLLLLGMVTRVLWQRLALRDHPWRLETSVDILAAKCNDEPGASVFSGETAALSIEIGDAKQCLQEADGTWTLLRDYMPCHRLLLQAGLTAWSIQLRKALRLSDEEIRLSHLLSSLEFELRAEDQALASGARYEVRHVAESQARILSDQARRLMTLGRTESALIAVLRAGTAWRRSETFRADELARLDNSTLRLRWEKQAADLLRWTKQSGRPAILVDKLQHRCLLLANGRVAKSYAANLGRNWFRNKVQENDAATPEGEYRILRRFRSTSFGWALLINYPNAADRARFTSMSQSGQLAAGARIGGNIEIHGGGRRNSDWTDGCVSLENADMEDLYRRAYVGMPVTIVGSCGLGTGTKD